MTAFIPDVCLRRAKQGILGCILTTMLTVLTVSNALAQAPLISPAPGVPSTITLACNPFPPAKITNEARKPGYDVEIIRAAFASRDIAVLTPFYPWKRAYFLAQSGQVDGLCSCSYLPEREKDFFYSDQLGSVRVNLYATNPDILARIDTLADARHLTVGIVNGYSLEVSARENGLDVLVANKEVLLINLLLSRRIDAILSFREAMEYALGTMHRNMRQALNIQTKEMSDDPYYACFSRKADNAGYLTEQFNIGLRTISENGLRQSILQKYGIIVKTGDTPPEIDR